MSLTIATGLFCQLFLATLAYAAPMMEAKAVDNTWTYGTGGGIIGFIVLVLDIIAFSMRSQKLSFILAFTDI